MNGLTDPWTPADCREQLGAVLKGTDFFFLSLLENICSFSPPSSGAIHKTRNAINRSFVVTQGPSLRYALDGAEDTV